MNLGDGASNGDHLIFSGAKLLPSETAYLCMFFKNIVYKY